MQQIGLRRSLLYVDGKGTGTGLQYHALTIPIPYPTFEDDVENAME